MPPESSLCSQLGCYPITACSPTARGAPNLKGYALCRRPPVNMHLMTGMTGNRKHKKKYDFGRPGTSILTFWGVILVSWGTILVILKSHGHPTGHLGDQTWILVDFCSFWEPLGTNFGVILTTSSRSGATYWSTVSRVGFLVILDWTWHRDAMPGCA